MKEIDSNSRYTSTNINQSQSLAVRNTSESGSIPTTSQDSVTTNSNVSPTNNPTTSLYNKNVNIDKISAEKFINLSKAKVAYKIVVSEWGAENFTKMIGDAIMTCINADELSELWDWSYKRSGLTSKIIAKFLKVEEFFIDIASIIKQKIDQKLIKGPIKFKNQDSKEAFNLINNNFKSNCKYKEPSNEAEKTYLQIKAKYTNILVAFSNDNFNLGNSLVKDFLENFETFFDYSKQESRFDYIIYLKDIMKLLNYDFQDHYIDKFEKFFEVKDDKNIIVRFCVHVAMIYTYNYELDKAKPYLQKLENFYQNADIKQILIWNIGGAFCNFAEKAIDYGNLSKAKEYYYKSWKIFTDNKLIAKDKYTENLNHACLLDEDNINYKEQINSWFYEATQRLIFCAVKTGDQSYCQELINYFTGTDIGVLLNNIYTSNLSKADVVSINDIDKKNIPSQLQSLLISKEKSKEKSSKKFIQSISKGIEKGTFPIESGIEVLIKANRVSDIQALLNKIPEDQIEKNIKLLQQSIYLAEVKKNLYREIESYDLAPQPKAFLHFKAAEKFLSKPGKALEHINRATELYPDNESYQLLKQMIIISMDKSKAEPELFTDLNKKAQKVEKTKVESVMPINAILAETPKNIEESANDEHILDDEGEVYYQDTANDQKKLHEHEQLRKKQEQAFLSNQNVKPEQRILTIAGEDILYLQTTEVTDIRGIKHRVYITKSVLEALGAESEQFLLAMNKGFVKPKGKNGIVYHGKNLIKVKTQSDTRIFTDKIYVTPEGTSYIIFDRISNNHKETSKIARASTIETIAIKIDDNQKA